MSKVTVTSYSFLHQMSNVSALLLDDPVIRRRHWLTARSMKRY